MWRDASGNVLQDGDTVVVIKDLKLEVGGGVVKQGTKVKRHSQCDSATILLERGGQWVKRIRIEVLPLGGTGTIFDGW